MENDELDSVTTNLKFSLYRNMFFIGGGFMKIGILIPIFLFFGFNVFGFECSPTFIETFKNKSNCKNGDAVACATLAFGSGVIATAWIGATTIKPNSLELKKFKEFVLEIREFKKINYASLQEAMKIRDIALYNAFNELTKNQIPFNEHSTWADKYSEIRARNTQLDKSIRKLAVKTMQKNISTNPYMKDIIDSTVMSSELYPAAAFEKYSARLKNLLNKTYPNEMNSLQTLHDTNLKNLNSDFDGDLAEVQKKFEAAIEKTTNSKLVRLLHSLELLTTAEHETFWYMWAQKSGSSYKNKISRQYAARAIRTAKDSFRSKPGITTRAVVGALAPTVAGILASKYALDSCKTKFNFNDQDVSFLTTRTLGSNFFNFQCDDLEFSNIQVIDEAIAKDGELSPGLCNLLHHQDLKSDTVLIPNFKTVDLGCSFLTGTSASFNVSVSNGLFRFQDLATGTNITAPIYKDGWPDFNQAEVDKDLAASRFKTTQFRDRYRMIHAPSNSFNAGKSPQQIDVESSCGRQSVLDCNLMKAASGAFMAISSQKMACDK